MINEKFNIEAAEGLPLWRGQGGGEFLQIILFLDNIIQNTDEKTFIYRQRRSSN